MFRNQPKYKNIYLATDIIIFTLSFLFADLIAQKIFITIFSRDIYFIIKALILYLLYLSIYVFYFQYNNLYNRNIIFSKIKQIKVVLKSLITAQINVYILFIVLNYIKIGFLNQKFLLFCFVINCLLITIWRPFITIEIVNFLAKNKYYQNRILIIGGDRAGNHVAKQLSKAKAIKNFYIVGILDDYKDVGKRINHKYYNLAKINEIDLIIEKYKVTEIIIAIDNAPYERIEYILEKCLETGKIVRIYSDLLRVISDKMNVELYSDIPVLYFNSIRSKNSITWTIKRCIDIVVSFTCLILLIPLFITIAILIKLSSKGAIIYRQKRIGINGKPFILYKFRTMNLNNDHHQHKDFVTKFIKYNNIYKTENNIYKIVKDQRIFKFGEVLRKMSIDEFPQLFNVLKGDMSLVGPRPPLIYEWECYEEWHKKRLYTVPGCTGLWQVLGRSSVNFREMVIIDLYYISNMKLWLDLKIIINTIPVIFLGKGGY